MQMAHRATKRTPAVEQRIIDGLRGGTGLRTLCREEGMPGWRTVYDWLAADPDFAAAVALAREVGTDAIAEQALDLIDGDPPRVEGRIDPGHVQWRRAQVDTRLKLLACWNPKKYGTKQTVEVGNKDGEAFKTESNPAEVAANVAAQLRAGKRDA